VYRKPTKPNRQRRRVRSYVEQELAGYVIGNPIFRRPVRVRKDKIILAVSATVEHNGMTYMLENDRFWLGNRRVDSPAIEKRLRRELRRVKP
jgi:hypothetical protein